MQTYYTFHFLPGTILLQGVQVEKGLIYSIQVKFNTHQQKFTIIKRNSKTRYHSVLNLPCKMNIVGQIVVQVWEGYLVLCPDLLTNDDLVHIVELVPVLIPVNINE